MVAPSESRAWQAVLGTQLKACPNCQAVALEGQESCPTCGITPEDDRSWRGDYDILEPIALAEHLEACAGAGGIYNMHLENGRVLSEGELRRAAQLIRESRLTSRRRTHKRSRNHE